MRVITLLILSLGLVVLSDPIADFTGRDSVEIRLGEELGLVYKKSFYVPVLPVDPIVNSTSCDPIFLKAIMRAESDFRIHAESWAGAMGVAQFIPLTANWMGLRNPYDPVASTFKLCEYIRYLSRKFDSKREVLWAYHDGETRVRRTGPTEAGRKYAERVMKYYQEYKAFNKPEMFQDKVFVLLGAFYGFKNGFRASVGFEASLLGILDGTLNLNLEMSGFSLDSRIYLRFTHDFAPFLGFNPEGVFLGLSYRMGDLSSELVLSRRPEIYLMFWDFVGIRVGEESSLIVKVKP